MNNIENMNEFDKIRYFMKTLNKSTQMAINTNMNVVTLKDAKQIAIRVDSLQIKVMRLKKMKTVADVVLNGSLVTNVMKNHSLHQHLK
jgi:thiamine monophosphate kinase